MNAQLDIKTLERKTYLRYHSDGLWDIFLALFFLAFAAAMLADFAYLMGIWPAIFIPSVIKVKKNFAQKRLGYVKFSAKREARERTGKTMLMQKVLTNIALGLFLFRLDNNLPRDHKRLIWFFGSRYIHCNQVHGRVDKFSEAG